MWTSRLLASSLLGGDLIVNVDESAFATCAGNKMRWEFPTLKTRPADPLATAFNRKRPPPAYQYRLTLLAAMTPDRVVGIQLVHGSVDKTVYRNFLYGLLCGLRSDPLTKHRRIVLQQDNARIHHSAGSKIIQDFGVTCFFTARYSPDLSAIEMLFCHLKRRMLGLRPFNSRQEVVANVQRLCCELNEDPRRVRTIWRYTVRKWLEKIEET